MAQEHQQWDQQLMTLAQSKGMKLADMPKPMGDAEKQAMAAHKAMLQELALMKGAAFDSMYIASQVADHDKTLGKVMTAQAKLKNLDPQLTQMLSTLSQRLPQHREMAYSVLGKLDDTMKSGVGGSGSDPGSSDTGGSGSDTGGSLSDTGGSGMDTGGSHSDTGGSGMDTGGSGSDTGE